MSLYIHKDGQQYGPYSDDQVRSWLSSGYFRPTDLACYAGATTWAPLSTLGMGTYLPAVQPTGYMTNPPGSGWGLIITGTLLNLIGILLSATIIGAIIGIPMLIAGIPMSIYGSVKWYRRSMWNLKESVRMGVVQGMPSHGYLPPQNHWEQSRLPSPPRPVANFCSNCAGALDADAKFCPSCSAPTS